MANAHPPNANQPSEPPETLDIGGTISGRGDDALGQAGFKERERTETLDLSGGTISGKSKEALKQAGFKDQGWNPQKHRDTVRRNITYILLGILGGTLLFIFAIFILSLYHGDPTMTWASMKEMLQILLPAETALIGSAIGFYFGSHIQTDRPQRSEDQSSSPQEREN